MWEAALLENKQQRYDEMLAMLEDLTRIRNDYRVPALEELAKHHEHHTKDLSQALGLTRRAKRIGPSPELQHRESRLEKRLAKQQQQEAALL